MLVPGQAFPGEALGSIEDRLNPRFWSGHTLGQGDMDSPPNIPFPSPGVTDAFGAPGVLRVPGALRLPLEKLGVGDFFSLDDHEPGTFFLFHKEVLSGVPLSAEEIAAVSELPLPQSASFVPHSTTSDTAKLPLRYFEAGEDGQRAYSSMVYGGMVQEVGRINRRKAVISFPLFGGFRSSEPQSTGSTSDGTMGMVFYAGPPNIEPDSFDVGMPSHFLNSVHGEQTIQRVNFMELHIEGVPEAADQPAAEHVSGASLV